MCPVSKLGKSEKWRSKVLFFIFSLQKNVSASFGIPQQEPSGLSFSSSSNTLCPIITSGRQLKGEKVRKSHTNLGNTECQTCAISAQVIDGGSKRAEWAPEPDILLRKLWHPCVHLQSPNTILPPLASKNRSHGSSLLLVSTVIRQRNQTAGL